MRSSVRKIGNSAGVILPKPVLTSIGANVGDTVDVTLEDGRIVIAPVNAARPFARFALCGMISQYNETGEPKGPSNIIQAVGKSLRLEGFIVSNHYDLAPQFIADMAGWIGSGQIKWNETIEEGVERAPDAFIKLFNGENLGKMLVKLG
jgi:putative addiction module antidote